MTTTAKTAIPTQTDRFVCYFDVQNCPPLLQDGTLEQIATAFGTALGTCSNLPQPYTGDVEVFRAKSPSL
jgi:hypothetical protein